MTETTALLRALHCDLSAACALLAALFYKKGVKDYPYVETASKALQKAGTYYRLADKLEEAK